MEKQICPVCGKKEYVENEIQYEIPHIGKFHMIFGRCNHCNYKFQSMIPLEKGNKKIIKEKINKDTLNKIVVRSPYCKISIPELGISLEPAKKSEGFITTIEGVLRKFIELTNIIDNKKKKEIIKKLENLAEGKEEATLILEDNNGMSKIIEFK